MRSVALDMTFPYKTKHLYDNVASTISKTNVDYIVRSGVHHDQKGKLAHTYVSRHPYLE